MAGVRVETGTTTSVILLVERIVRESWNSKHSSRLKETREYKKKNTNDNYEYRLLGKLNLIKK